MRAPNWTDLFIFVSTVMWFWVGCLFFSLYGAIGIGVLWLLFLSNYGKIRAVAIHLYERRK